MPLACQDWANTKAAHRSLSNDRVCEADVFAGHFQSTRGRSGTTHDMLLVLHDTTEFSFQRGDPSQIGLTREYRTGKKADRRKPPRKVCGIFDAFKPRNNGQRSAARSGGSQILD
jgi:hypothetical protein